MEGSPEKDSILKDIINFLSSMRAGLILLLILAAASTIGSFFPQQEEAEFYYEQYSEFTAEIILTVGIDNIFEAWWFVGLIGLVCANLFFCSLRRLPGIYRRAFKPQKITDEENIKKLNNSSEFTVKYEKGEPVQEKVKNQFKNLGFKVEVDENENGEKVVFAEKGRYGYLGSFLTHLSIVIIIVGFAYGNYAGFDDFVYGVPGDTVSAEKADFELRIDDFEVDYRDDYSVEQYYSTLTVLDNGEEKRQEEIYVNRPLKYSGINFYQSTHGWTGKLSIEDQDNNYENTVRMYEGGHYHYQGENKVIYFSAFYPDYDVGVDGPINVSPKPNNPHFIWQLYVDNQMVDMFVSAPGEMVQYGNTEFKFHDYAQYTGLSVTYDPGVPVFIAGSIIMLVGLVFSFYLYPRRFWAVIPSRQEGDKQKVIIGGRGIKDRTSFEREFNDVLIKLKGGKGE